MRRSRSLQQILAGLALIGLAGAAPPQDDAASAPQPHLRDLGPNLERFHYPFPVQTMAVTLMGRPAQMAYMDLAPDRPNGRTVVLLHGKNFCGATWEPTALALRDAGYRVVIPDQIGFCKSSKPRELQYSFDLLATLTRRLLETRGITRATVVGHSFGGMLAMRYAILFPQAVERMVLVDPIGLKDRSEEGLPYSDIDTLWATERRTTYQSIRQYQQANYYHGTWRPEFDRWVWMQAGMYQGAGRDLTALSQAKISEMIHTQPVAHELERITVPTTLIVGTLDRVAFGRQQAPPSLQRFLQAIPLLAPAAARRMRHATLVTMPGLGHVPQLEAPERFNATLLAVIRQPVPPSAAD